MLQKWGRFLYDRDVQKWFTKFHDFVKRAPKQALLQHTKVQKYQKTSFVGRFCVTIMSSLSHLNERTNDLLNYVTKTQYVKVTNHSESVELSLFPVSPVTELLTRFATEEVGPQHTPPDQVRPDDWQLMRDIQNRSAVNKFLQPYGW